MISTMWKPKVAGIILIIIGIGIPLLPLVVTIVYMLFYPPEQYAFFTLPFIILALWALPLAGGIYALRRKKLRLALAGSITAILYIVPSVVLSANLIMDYVIRRYDADFLPMIILFCLLLLITLPAIPATVFIAVSRKEFE
jgi:hypothetical protein